MIISLSNLWFAFRFFPSKKEWTLLPLGDLSAPERYRVAAGSVVMPGKAPFAYAKQHQGSPKHLSSTSFVRTREVVTHPLFFANDADIGRVIICGIQYPSNYVIYIVYTVPRVWGSSQQFQRSWPQFTQHMWATPQTPTEALHAHPGQQQSSPCPEETCGCKYLRNHLTLQHPPTPTHQKQKKLQKKNICIYIQYEGSGGFFSDILSILESHQPHFQWIQGTTAQDHMPDTVLEADDGGWISFWVVAMVAVMIMDEKKSQVACHGLRVKGSLHCSALTSALLHKDRFGKPKRQNQNPQWW